MTILSWGLSTWDMSIWMIRQRNIIIQSLSLRMKFSCSVKSFRIMSIALTISSCLPFGHKLSAKSMSRWECNDWLGRVFRSGCRKGWNPRTYKHIIILLMLNERNGAYRCTIHIFSLIAGCWWGGIWHIHNAAG